MGGIDIKLEVLNQLQTPAFYAASLANRPAFGFAGRVFIDTDIPSTGLYRDTGSAWVSIADPGTGTTGTLQQVTTNGNTSNQGIAISANGIGIGTTIPASNRIDIHSGSGIQATLNGTTTTNAGLQLQNAGVSKWRIRNNYNSNANDFGIYDETNAIDRIKITNTGIISLTGITNFSSRVNVNGAADVSAYSMNINGYAAFNSPTDWIVKENTGSGYGLFKQTATSISIKADNVTRFIVDGTSGNVTCGASSGTGLGAFYSGSGTFNLNVSVGSSATNTAGLIVKGGSSIGTPSSSSGQILIGNTSTYRGSLAYDDNTGYLYIDNLYDNVNSNIYIRTRTAGTPINALTILGTGAATFSNTLGINGTSNNVKSGFYTPILTNVTGTSGLIGIRSQYSQIGNIVTVAFSAAGSCTAASQNLFTVSVPFGSVFSGAQVGCGTASGTNSAASSTFTANVVTYSGVAAMIVQFNAPLAVIDFSFTGVFQYEIQ